jgi:hypothetical protein
MFRNIGFAVFGFMLLTVMVIGAGIAETPNAGIPETPTAETPKLACDPGAPMQTRRQAIISGLQREKIVHKISTPGTLPRVYVLPRFYTLTFDDKQNFMGVVYAWVFECKIGNLLRIFDAQTNKSIGNIDETGLSF